MEPKILAAIDDSNVYKIAKIMGLTFESDEVEPELIYSYFVLLSSRNNKEKKLILSSDVNKFIVYFPIPSLQQSSFYLSLQLFPLKTITL